MKEPKVLYLAGAHRSGTTMLTSVLGGYDGIFAAGELHEIWQNLIEGQPCGCGRPLELCPVCGPIFEEVCEVTLPNSLTPAEAVRWRKHSARSWHTGRILRQVGRPDRSSPTTRYAALIGKLYAVTARRTGSRVVIDSTKTPSGAALLLMMDHLSAYILHLVRDPRATAHSWSKRKVKGFSDYKEPLMEQGVLYSSLQWLGYNLIAERVCRRRGDGWLRLRYEDLAAHPRAHANALVSWLGIQTGRDPFEQPDLARLADSHIIAGNPDRFDTGTKRIRPDNRWIEAMSTADRWMVTALSLPLMLRYGYRPGRYTSAEIPPERSTR
jgi:Sulfotransferase family